MQRTLVALTSLVALAACRDTGAPFTEPMKLGGRDVPAATLNAGRVAYMHYCRTCHGEKGDGQGPSAPGLRPPPRDLTQGFFKFAAVPGGTLPHDEDLKRIVKRGLHGTAMLPWDVPEHELDAIVQYVKTFSPRWKDEEPGEAIVATPDPWLGRELEGAARGKKVYHGLAQCSGCHPAYASKQFVYEAARELTGAVSVDFRQDMYGSEVKASDYGVKLLPPDFTRHEMRSVRDATRKEDLYRVIASGVGGTAMPTWKGALPEEEIWAMVHYVSTLIGLKEAPDQVAKMLAESLKANEGWVPPPPPSTN
jgi:mono/diheme cytochrome c family protein